MNYVGSFARAGDDLGRVIDESRDALGAVQREDGHWLYELEADVTITSEYILLKHYLDEVDPETEQAMAVYLRENQRDHGGWSLFEEGEPDISATVKAYFALKLAGDDPEAPHMRRARALVLAQGGAARANVFTRIMLALFGEVPWHAVPVMPVEIMHLPRWFPFHIEKISYWSRTVIVPMLIVMALRPRAKNPTGRGVRELFTTPPEEEPDFITSPKGAKLGPAFVALDKVLRAAEPFFPKASRQRAIEKAVAFITERLNGEDGVGGIYPAMAFTVIAFHELGYRPDHPDLVIARKSVEKLVVRSGSRVYCQPCLSPVWDTSLAMHAMMEAGEPGDSERIAKAAEWLLEREIRDRKGDWSWRRPNLAPGGWAFQYRNDFYPDVDDTAVVAMALHRADPERYKEPLERAAAWIIGMQSSSGGWGAFDVDNDFQYLNAIPFADHGALLDPPTVDVTARCLSMLAQLGYGRDHETVRRGIEYLRREQEADGSWYGRWGVNYVYGTWSTLCALNALGFPPDDPMVQRGVAYLKSMQRPDGGFGEDCATYDETRIGEVKGSTASQTAWALLGLMAAGEADSEEVARGVAYLRDAPREGSRWVESLWTGTGFPRVFYLKYHGYSAYFPLWALSRYRNLRRSNSRRVAHGM